ncbi:MAG: hypothetical protein AAGA30_16590 [Planctomycetota bacterium]
MTNRSESESKRARKWKSFSVKTMLIFITVFACWLGWYIPRVQRQKEAVEWVESIGGSLQAKAFYDFEIMDPGTFAYKRNATSPIHQWLVNSLGIDFFHSVHHVLLNVEPSIDDPSKLGGFPRLRMVQIGRTNAQDLSSFASLGEIEAIDISGSNISSLRGVENCRRLRYLSVVGPVASVEPLRELRQLRRLMIFGYSSNQLADLTPLENSTDLNMLEVYGSDVSDLSPLSSLDSLQKLNIGSTQVKDLSPLVALKNLNSLDLRGLVLDEWGPLSKLTSLKELRLNMTNFDDLSLLQEMDQLVSLSLPGFEPNRVFDLSAIAGLTKLESLDLSNSLVENADVLPRLPALTKLIMRRNDSVPEEVLESIKLNRPSLRVYQ